MWFAGDPIASMARNSTKIVDLPLLGTLKDQTRRWDLQILLTSCGTWQVLLPLWIAIQRSLSIARYLVLLKTRRRALQKSLTSKLLSSRRVLNSSSDIIFIHISRTYKILNFFDLEIYFSTLWERGMRERLFPRRFIFIDGKDH